MHARDVAKTIKEMIDTDKFINMNIATEENYTVDKIANIALQVCDARDLKIFMIAQSLMDNIEKILI